MILPPVPNVSSPYLGPVANRAHSCNSVAGFQQCMSEGRHWLRDNVSFLVLVFARFQASNGTELPIGSPATYTAGVSSDFSTDYAFRTATFGGATAGTCPDAGLLFSDPIPFSGMRGQPIRIRSLQSTAGAILFDGQHASTADGMLYGTGVPDLTGGGPLVSRDPPGTNWAPPIAILGYTTRPTFFLLGDSIEWGYNETVTDAIGDVGVLGRSIGREYGFIHGGIPSATMTGFLQGGTQIASRLKLASLCSTIINQLVINDLPGAASVASLTAQRTAIAGMFPRKRVFGTTCTPKTTSADNWTTTAMQTVTAQEAIRTGFNAAERMGVAGEAGVVDLADGLESDRDSGRWAVGTLPGAVAGASPTADGLHPSGFGSDNLRRRGVVPLSWL